MARNCITHSRGAILVAVLVLSCAGTGCGLVRVYRCTSDMEQQAFNIAARNIYPDDVRITPKGYVDKAVVAWATVVIESRYSERGDEIEIELLLEHHHFDWLEDFKLGENIYVLSKRGEGRIHTYWPVRADLGLEVVERWSAPGNMAVVYGMPVKVQNGIIELEAYCVRFILPHRYRFSEYPYGRDSGWQY